MNGQPESGSTAHVFSESTGFRTHRGLSPDWSGVLAFSLLICNIGTLFASLQQVAVRVRQPKVPWSARWNAFESQIAMQPTPLTETQESR